MLRTLGLVDACYDSSAARCRAGRKLGAKTVLEWVVRRATDCQQLDGVIVVTTNAPENGFVARLVPSDVPVFVGPDTDALSSVTAALETYPARAVVRIAPSCPLVDPVLIDRLVVRAESAQEPWDYVSYCCRDGRPVVLSPVGLYAEWFRSKALQEAARLARSPLDRQQVTRYLYTHPDRFRVHLIPVPCKLDRDDVRLTVDIEEDWEHLVTIVEALGPDELDWQRIADLLDQQPALRKRMAALNRVHTHG